MEQETLEEAAKRKFQNIGDRLIFEDGAKWQQERSYSEEDIREAFLAGVEKESYRGLNFDEWFKQFKTTK
jgi:hypothetical protein